MSLIDRYFAALHAHLAAIEQEGRANIETAASLCADAMAAGGVVHLYDTGHLVSRELVNRAGGLVGFTPLNFSLQVDNPNRYRQSHEGMPKQPLAVIDSVLSASNMRAGDVLIIGSVSGKSATVVELALRARERGLTVIALTAPAYSGRLASEHPSGRRLFEVADLVLDNGAPYGDAMLEVEGLPYPVCPASGVGAAVTLWAVVAGIIEKLMARGLEPSVFPSVNLPDGPALVEAVRARYQERGY